MLREERVKQSDFEQDFQTKDTTFTGEAESEFHGSKKLDRLQKKAEKAGKKTEKLPGRCAGGSIAAATIPAGVWLWIL